MLCKHDKRICAHLDRPLDDSPRLDGHVLARDRRVRRDVDALYLHHIIWLTARRPDPAATGCRSRDRRPEWAHITLDLVKRRFCLRLKDVDKVWLAVRVGTSGCGDGSLGGVVEDELALLGRSSECCSGEAACKEDRCGKELHAVGCWEEM